MSRNSLEVLDRARQCLQEVRSRDESYQSDESSAAVGGDIGEYAPARSCAGCGLRLWWLRPDGAWVCAVCQPDPVKCRQCDRPQYSHVVWPMVCDGLERQA